MSFILDALRKSETERQRQSGPGLIDAGHRPPASRRALWLPVLVLVLAANLAVMAFLWLRQPAQPSPQAVQTQPVALPDAARSAGSPAAADAAPAPTVVPGAAVAAADNEAAYATTADMPALETTAGATTEVLQPPPNAAADGQQAAAGAVIQEGLPTAGELIASGAISTPALHLDIHVFTADPAGRFVFINMRKYTEGALLTEGPRLEEITREGAVLSQNGRRFILNRD
ncbi:MAG: general secretion pathway protein GspB [Gammaproteobacteria bacterium]|nr:general secretion pathway protein GspB [Gammaproteobacteria bacterium]QOJ33050.1 MAG: general secretion pathway protein GspB [Gammaproteobacteria bacterium]